MALSASNVSYFPWFETDNLSQYLSDSNIFSANSEQYIAVRGYDVGAVGGASATGVPTTPDIVWTYVTKASRGNGVVALYKATITDEVIGQTTIDYPATQVNCAICIVQVTNAETAVVQSKTGDWDATSGSITMDSAITAGNLALNFVASMQTTATRNYTAGTNETALTGLNVPLFVQYNFADDNVLDAGTPDDDGYGSIGIEVEEIAVVPDEDVVTLCTLYFTDDGDPVTGSAVICESALGFEVGMTAELWPANVEANAITATLIEAIDTAPTATPQYNITFSAAVASGVDTLHITYDDTVGDIKSVTGGIALVSATFDATTAMSC